MFDYGSFIKDTATLNVIAYNVVPVTTYRAPITLHSFPTTLSANLISDGLTGTLTIPVNSDDDDGSGEDKYNEDAPAITSVITAVAEANGGNATSCENIENNGATVANAVNEDNDQVTVTLHPKTALQNG